MKNNLLKPASVIAGSKSSPEKVIRLSRICSSFHSKHIFMPSFAHRVIMRFIEAV